MELLFLEFKSLSKVSRDAGDEESANLIDFLCEREQQAKEMEKEQIINAANSENSVDINYGEQYYNKTFGGNK